MRTDLELCCGYSVVEELIPEIEHEPDSSRHAANGDSSLGGGVDRENNIGSETKHGGVQPIRQRQQARETFGTDIIIPAERH